MQNTESYNQRLFSKGIRKSMHMARFNWLQKRVSEIPLNQFKVVELGCFDGRALSYLPAKIESYDGYDANWEKGLDQAKLDWGKENIRFHQCTEVDHFTCNDSFNLFISLETLEHLPPSEIGDYLNYVHKNITKNGYLFISVPNEIGILFVAKQIYKKIFLKDELGYSLKEFFFQAIGRVDKVSRNEHKGFSYKQFKNTLETDFEIKRCEGLQWRFIPKFLNMSIGFICVKK
jgi:2-polyprenyl-3-methyl-5-hydroxy-6-metoxy-1,4-benzoquinol methylase